MSYSVKSIRKQFRDQGIFYTNAALAEYMKSFLPKDADAVYDPACGHGNLLAVFDEDVKKYGQDIREEATNAARQLPNSRIVCADTLKEPAFIGKKFRAIIANPPFSAKWEAKEDARFADCGILPPPSKADYAFILHCLYYLANDGVACVMCSPGVCYRGQREGKIRRWLIEQNVIDAVVDIAGGEFEDTNIATVLLILRKDRVEKSSIHFFDKETGKGRDVPIAEIADNDFSLNLTTYIDLQPPPAPIDIDEVNRDARESFLHVVRTRLQLEVMIYHTFHGPDYHDTIREIRSILDEIEREDNYLTEGKIWN